MAQKGLLDGKIALVTGAGQGIGAACARYLAQSGATVVVTDLNGANAALTAQSIADEGFNAISHTLDAADENQWRTVYEDVGQRYGKLDVLVNNAGVVEIVPYEEITGDHFERIMRINVKSVFLGSKLGFELMKTSGKASIINMSSVTAMIATLAGFAAYSTSKAAIRQLSKSTALEYVGHGIRVNSIHPGGIDTPMARPYLENPDTVSWVIGHTPMGRAGRPEEIAAVVAFLASDEASYMTGSEVVVDGGWTAT